MSSSVTIDWRAIRERERQACLTLRAELAQLRAREKQLRLRSVAVGAAHGRVTVAIHRVGRAHASADSAELGRLVSEAQAGLAHSAAELEQAISRASHERVSRSSATSAWTTRSGPELAAAPLVGPDIELDMLAREPGRRPARGNEGAALAAEADAVLEECRLRCPETDLTELTALRAELGRSPLGDRAVIQDIRARAARTIQRVKRENELEEQRQRLFVLAEETPAAERAALRRRAADAPAEDLPRLDREVTAAVERASAERARAEAVTALEQSLLELGYDVQGGFASLLPATAASAPSQGPAAAAQPTPRFLVAASPHSAEHGLRVRVGPDQVYLSVVRRAGTAGHDVRRVDTEVQEKTCQDLVTATASAAGKGVQIVIGNVQSPGHQAPELGAEHWPTTATAQAETAAAGQAETAAAGQAETDRRQAWAAQERQRTARQAQARPRRPGP